MKTDIEEYIQHNRESLDIDSPPADLWAGIEKGLSEKKEKKRRGFAYFKVAATGALLIGAGYLLNDLLRWQAEKETDVAQKVVVDPYDELYIHSGSYNISSDSVQMTNFMRGRGDQMGQAGFLNNNQSNAQTGRIMIDLPGQKQSDNNAYRQNIQQGTVNNKWSTDGTQNANGFKFQHNLDPQYTYVAPGEYGVDLTTNAPLAVTLTDPSCNVSCDGQATVATTGGTTPYTYTWVDNANATTNGTSSNGVIDITARGSSSKYFGGIEQVTSGLATSSYTVTVTDANGSMATSNTPVITNPTTSDGYYSIANNADQSTLYNVTGTGTTNSQNTPNAFTPDAHTQMLFTARRPDQRTLRTPPHPFTGDPQGQDKDMGHLNYKGGNNAIRGHEDVYVSEYDQGVKWALPPDIALNGSKQQGTDATWQWDFGNGAGDLWHTPVDSDGDGIPDVKENIATRENYEPIVENVFRQSLHEPLSTFSIDVDAASYSNVRRMVNAGQVPPPNAVKIEELINYFDYDYPQPKNEHPFAISTEIAKCPWNTKHKLVRIGIQGKDVAVQQLPPSNLVFLIDVSGSMQMPDKLPLLKKSMKLLVKQMRAEDRISLITYAGTAGVRLKPTAGDQKTLIYKAIDELEAGGSTAGEAGIRKAYELAAKNYHKDGNNRVVLATDGDFNVGISGDDALVKLIEKKRETGVFLSVLGFGTGNYQDAKMEKLADNGNGNFAYIDNILEAKKVMVTEMAGTLFTIAKDVKLQIEFNPSKVKSYRLIGYENRMLENKDFADDKKDAGELGAGHEVTALYEINPITEEAPWWKDGEELKYQKMVTPEEHAAEIMTLKFRYKKPDGKKSKLIVHTLKDSNSDNPSPNFKFAVAVAEYGLLLRNSRFKGTASYDHVINWAKAGKGADVNGYRSEFINLVEKYSLSVKAK
jgi:Ca-activated chloride channel family protein